MLRLNKTSGAKLVHTQGKGARQFVVTPGHIHFGTVQMGSVAHRSARVWNTSMERARFSVIRPELPLRVLYKPGPVASGRRSGACCWQHV